MMTTFFPKLPTPVLAAPRRGLALLVFVLVGLVSFGAAAQEDQPVPPQNGDGLDTHLFRPAVDSKGFMYVNGTDILGHNSLSFGLVLDYGRDILRENEDRDGAGDSLISDSFQGTLSINYGLLNHFVIGLSLPAYIVNGPASSELGEDGNLYDTNALDFQSIIGGIAGHVKWRALKVEKGFGLAVLVQGGTAFGEAERSFANHPGFWYWPRLLMETRAFREVLRVGVNVGYRGQTGTGARFQRDSNGLDQLAEGELEGGNLVTYGAAVSARVLPPLELVAENYGSLLTGTDSSSGQALSQETIAGVKLYVEKNSYLMLGGGTRLWSVGHEAADLRMVLGFVFEPSIGDRDGDGIKDDEDACPDNPEDKDGVEDSDGCPEDNDKDGIPDDEDKCPNIPEDMDGDDDEDGCPESRMGDKDGDGILDAQDKCPNVPEDKDGFEDEDGCPDPDNDKDGIPDSKDKCPNVAETKNGYKDDDGCPDQADRDNDKIPDINDKCPDKPEDYDGVQDEDGCPEGDVIREGDEIMILQKIHFARGSAKILQESFNIIDEVAKVLKENDDIEVIEIAGHADERGPDYLNLRLTKSRAASVVKALTARGIGKDRLVSQGYGEYCPVDKASNKKAWDKNRRVDFKIVKSDGELTDSPRGCQRASDRGIKPPPVK